MPPVARELIAVARRITETLRPPVVARVFVPGSHSPEQHGSFCAVELADGSTGLAYVLLGETWQRLRSSDPTAAVGRDALALAEGFTREDDPGARSLGLAAINALSRHLLDRAGFVPDFAANSMGSLALGPGDRLGMVGFFPPLVRRACEQGIPLTVLELKSELVQEGPGLTVTLDPARLADCSKVVCTSTTLLNDSLDAVLEHARGCREFVLIGPSAGCIPDALFARGVTAIGGSWVTDPQRLMERAARGETWGDAARKFSLRNDAAWPGFEELLRRGRR